MALPPESGAPPHWLAYISSPDVDATASRRKRSARKTLVAPNDVPTVGRFAVMSDPQGAIFAIFTPAKQAPGHEGPPAQGEFSWHELATREQPAAFRFYETLFGWNKTTAMDMGPDRPVSDVRPQRRRARRDVQQAGRDAWSAGLAALHHGR